MDFYVSGKRVRVSPRHSIGKGGEADVYQIAGDRALKIWKTAEHPDFDGQPEEQRAATARIDEMQQKLPAFPHDLPPRVVAPQEPATDRNGRHVVGYTMRRIAGAEPLLRYSQPGFRSAGVDGNTVVRLFRDLHETVLRLHRAGVVIGDFNDLNVLVTGTEAHVIDADSFQFGQYCCKVFTARFVDPLLCDPTVARPVPCRPHSSSSDWYAFTLLLTQCLLLVGAYGGVYAPRNPADRVGHDARPMRRITIFHPEVRYPKVAIPYSRLPDEMLDHLVSVCQQDERGVFPRHLLDELRWTRCTTCGTEHARHVCPGCSPTSPAAVREVTRVRGTVRATRVMQTDGVVVSAALAAGRLVWLEHCSGQFRREGGDAVLSGEPSPRMRVRLRGKATMVARDGQLITLRAGQPPEHQAVDQFAQRPMFDVNQQHSYWLSAGRLLRDGPLGAEYIGDVLPDQTQFWVGPRFGFGLYRAGTLSVAFVFDARRSGINDTVRLPRLAGQLVDANCTFSDERCWFFTTTQESGTLVHRATVLRADGSIEATATDDSGDGGWLNPAHGKCAAGRMLLAATNGGLVRVEVQGGQLAVTKEFPDTEPFVHTGCQLLPSDAGLYVISNKEIQLVCMS